MKINLCILLSMLTLNAYAGQDRGGGDLCENRIQVIRDDIANWIRNGGPNGLEGLKVPVSEYSTKMSKYLSTSINKNGSVSSYTDIECIHSPIKVQGREKVCRFDNRLLGPKITCYYEAFLDEKTISEDEQYQLIHHEYAGLAGLENPDGSQSTYVISDQISSFLEVQTIRKLAVKNKANLNNEQVSLYTKRIAAAIKQQQRSDRSDHLECRLVAGGMVYGNGKTESEGVAENSARALLESKTVEINSVDSRQVFTFDTQNSWNPHVRIKTVVTLSADNKTVDSVLYNKYRNDLERNGGDLANPYVITGWQLTDILQCNKTM